MTQLQPKPTTPVAQPAQPAQPVQSFATVAQSVAAYIQDHRARQAADPYRRILLVGASGSGKTYSTLASMPTPIIIADVDDQMAGAPARGLGEILRADFTDFDAARKAYDGDEVECTFDCVLGWLQDGARNLITKFNHKCTIFVDGVSILGDSLMSILEDSPNTKANKYWLWQEWSRKWRDLSTSIKQLQCNVVVSAHEQPEYEYINDKPKLVQHTWYLPGNQFSPRFSQFFTDAILQRREVKTPTVNMTTTAFPDKTLSQASPKVEIKYFWQIQPETLRPWIKSRSKSRDLLIAASWEALTKE